MQNDNSSKQALCAEQRQTLILQMLERQSSVQVAQLSSAFEVSRVTIRADLDSLANQGKLRRTHGGALSLSQRLTVSTQDRRINVNVKAKANIARAAAALVNDGDVLMVDSGTTALEFVKALAHKQDLVVITQDFTIADTIDRAYNNIDVIMLGGNLRKAHRYTSGPVALAALDVLHADKAFICPGSYIVGKGCMTNFSAMASVKKKLIESATSSYLLLDKTKIGASGVMAFADLGDFDGVIIDEDVENTLGRLCKKIGTELVVAQGAYGKTQ